MLLEILAFAALAETDPPAAASPARVHTNPDWVRRPSINDLNVVWPAAALKRGVGGKVRLRCLVAVTGFAQSCSVISERPAGLGLGAAALSLSGDFFFKPATDDGAPVASWVDIPIDFPSRVRTGNDRSISVHTLANPTWLSTPAPGAIAGAYPSKGAGVSGLVAFRCEAEKDGRLSDCDITQETPAGKGFARAARSLLPLYKLDPAQTQSHWTTIVTVQVRLDPPARGS